MRKIIYLAGGCFWGVERYYQLLKGVISTEVGYANGNKDNPKYEELKNGIASHAETLKLEYDDEVISLENILEHFLRFVDPYSVDQQGHDIGHQYRSGVYYIDPKEEKEIRNYFDKVLDKNYKIEVLPLSNYFKAEEYHQNYLVKNPGGYCHVNMGLIKQKEKKN